MPELILFAACKNITQDADGLVSLIDIIERMEVTVPTNFPLPPHAAIPQRWQTIAIWKLEQSETGQYEQMADIILPDGYVPMHTEPRTLETTNSGSAGSKIISTLLAVPIIDGPLRLRLSYRRIGEQGWTEVAKYPVDVTVTRR